MVASLRVVLEVRAGSLTARPPSAILGRHPNLVKAGAPQRADLVLHVQNALCQDALMEQLGPHVPLASHASLAAVTVEATATPFNLVQLLWALHEVVRVDAATVQLISELVVAGEASTAEAAAALLVQTVAASPAAAAAPSRRPSPTMLLLLRRLVEARPAVSRCSAPRTRRQSPCPPRPHHRAQTPQRARPLAPRRPRPRRPTRR